tara:strand:+ start:235 stop:480 length:246 start_codon:yes stop_codon:yes gene_type:complete
MKQLKEQIRKESSYNSYDKETLVDMLIVAKQDLKAEKLQSSWLDTLADALRDLDDTELMDEAEEMEQYYYKLKSEIQKTRI